MGKNCFSFDSRCRGADDACEKQASTRTQKVESAGSIKILNIWEKIELSQSILLFLKTFILNDFKEYFNTKCLKDLVIDD